MRVPFKFAIFAILLILHCGEPDIIDMALQVCDYEVAYNPYSEVDWATWKKCLSQHHDHVGAIETRIRDYDEAGYNAICLLNYSGVQSLEFTSKQRIWPLSKFITRYGSDPDFLATTKNLKFFIPSMEEVGLEHATSPFLTKYLEVWEPEFTRRKRTWQYSSNQELIDLIKGFGGAAVIAHPTKRIGLYSKLEGFTAIEIYNAFYNLKHVTGKIEQDRNTHFLQVWDGLLVKKSSKIWGVAVNDHFGAYNKRVKESHPRIYDSGKTVVMLRDYTLADYRRSFEQGAFFAVHDSGLEKNRFPAIDDISVQGDSIEIACVESRVRWLAWGVVLREGSSLKLSELPCGMTYVRAEVQNENGIVYVQPFSLQEIFWKKR